MKSKGQEKVMGAQIKLFVRGKFEFLRFEARPFQQVHINMLTGSVLS